MGYQEYKPHHSLARYIDAYWVMRNEQPRAFTQRVLPDGCVDIIINTGNEVGAPDGTVTMRNDAVFVVGTMTRFSEVVLLPGSHLIGIRFKPLGFPSFYKFTSLHEITNQTIEFEKKLVPQIIGSDFMNTLNGFFSRRLMLPQPALDGVITTVQHHHGQITVEKLAKEHFVSKRTLERNFKQYLGVTPKEYIDFVRYKLTFDTILQNNTCRSLLDIAIEMGYYDHSHLTNEIKKYSGWLPSEL